MIETATELAREFLQRVKSLAEIQATPDVFKGATLMEEGRSLVFWAGSGRYEMSIGDAGNGVNVYMSRDSNAYRKWFIALNGFWLESETGANGEDFKGAAQGIARQLIETVGSHPTP